VTTGPAASPSTSSAAVRPRPRRLLAILAASSLVFGATTLEVATDPVARWELDLFTAVNGLPERLHVVIWPFMQVGVFAAIPVASVVAWAFRRRRLAVLLAVSGVSVYLLAKVVKRVAGRGRPDAFIADVIEREHFAAGSIGYPSGHAAVAASLATLAIVHLPRPWRVVTAALVATVAVGRVYVGGHLPLDVVGGAAMGIAAGTVAMAIAQMLSRPADGPRRPAVKIDP
jgi:membrane-associated phospholipid phosphatase